MKVIEYSEKWKQAWDDFVLNSNNGTMFHLQRFLDYHTPEKFTFNHLLVVDDLDRIIAVLPGSLKDGIFESPIGASYGSIVLGDYKFKKTMEIVTAIIKYGKANSYKGFLLTPAPMIYEKYQNQNLDFAMLWQGFKFDLHYISSGIKLDPNRDILERCSPTIRRNVRKTLKNSDIRVEINEKYEEFYPILIENKARFNIKPTHTYEDLLKLKELLPECLKLFMVYYKDKPIGGSLMFFPNKTIALCFYNMLIYDYEKYKPIQRVMYEVIKYCTDQGYSYIDIGVSQDTKAENPMTPSMSLIEFKEKFDAKTIMRNTLRLDL